ncbi:hypothetical protein Q8W14_13805 [Photobacterium damselae subsp. piscicida]|nr:hypothetical protein [Photobacterium damselae subsp. piscicida]
MREILTDINDYNLCVTEFVRVVDRLFPNSVFYRLCPELHNGEKLVQEPRFACKS